MDHLRQQAIESGETEFRESNSKNLGVGDYNSANDMRRIFVSTIDTDHVKSKNQDKEGVPEFQKQLIVLNFNGVDDERADCAGGVESLLSRRCART